MLFFSAEFLFIFLPIVILLTYLSHRFISPIYSLFFLSLSSIIFYSIHNIKSVYIILFSILFNFLMCKKIAKNKNIMIYFFAIFTNLLLLGYFKYRNFFIENINYVFYSNFQIIDLIIPLAISFYTFQQISYIIDIYNDRVGAVSFKEYLFFISFFPQLIAGPIILMEEMREQISNFLKKDYKIFKYFVFGFFIFTIGLFKKIVIADTIGIYVDEWFVNLADLNFYESWIAIISFAIQIYFDFSGYTDMAIGLALLFGFKLPINFKLPYKSLSIIEYWQKWHITMTRFFMNNIYVPIAVNFSRKYYDKNLSLIISSIALPSLLTFFFSGLWHGAGWKFTIFGLIHGFAIVINQIWKKYTKINLNKYISWTLTMFVVLISLVFFRAESFNSSVIMIKNLLLLKDLSQILTFNIGLFKDNFDKFFFLIIFIFSVFFIKYEKNYSELKDNIKIGYYSSFVIILIFYASIYLVERKQPFIYFQF